MYEIKRYGKHCPQAYKDRNEIDDFRGEMFAKKGWIELGKHFKEVWEKEVCTKCKQIKRKKVKRYSGVIQ